MPSMTVMRFCTDEEGRESVLPDYIVPAAEVKNYPWPPPTDLVAHKIDPHDDSPSFSGGMVGRPDGQSDEDWEHTIAVITRQLQEWPDAHVTSSLLVFRRHKVGETDPFADVPKGQRAMAAGALYVLVRTIEKASKEETDDRRQ